MSNQKELLETFLSTLPKTTTNNLTVVENTDNDKLLHISADRKLNKFVPRIGFSQLKSEDRTIPRICVARTLVGCILGYDRIVFDFHNRFDKTYERGYYIKSFDYEHSLVPDKKLVADVGITGEEWLVSYSSETSKYSSENIGKFFVQSITYIPIKDGGKIINVTLMLHTTEDMQLDTATRLSAGFYEIDIKDMNSCEYNLSEKDSKNMFTVTKITESDFNNIKKISTSLENMHPSAMW